MVSRRRSRRALSLVLLRRVRVEGGGGAAAGGGHGEGEALLGEAVLDDDDGAGGLRRGLGQLPTARSHGGAGAKVRVAEVPRQRSSGNSCRSCCCRCCRCSRQLPPDVAVHAALWPPDERRGVGGDYVLDHHLAALVVEALLEGGGERAAAAAAVIELLLLLLQVLLLLHHVRVVHHWRPSPSSGEVLLVHGGVVGGGLGPGLVVAVVFPGNVGVHRLDRAGETPGRKSEKCNKKSVKTLVFFLLENRTRRTK